MRWGAGVCEVENLTDRQAKRCAFDHRRDPVEPVARDVHDEICRGQAFRPQSLVRARTTAAEGLREAVFAGPGVCLASEWMFLPDLDNGRAKQVLPVWALPPMDLWAAYPTGRRTSARARALPPSSRISCAGPTSGSNPLRAKGFQPFAGPRTQKTPEPVAVARCERPPVRASGSWRPSRLAPKSRQPCRRPPRPCDTE